MYFSLKTPLKKRKNEKKVEFRKVKFVVVAVAVVVFVAVVGATYDSLVSNIRNVSKRCGFKNKNVIFLREINCC